MPRPKSATPRDSFANVRLTSEERKNIEATAHSLGLKSISEYVRHLHNLQNTKTEQNSAPYKVAPQTVYNGNRLQSFFATPHGQIYQGNSLDFLHSKAAKKSVDLIMTSPPFGLVRKKSY
jgi:site-specific DNA-methyltransferase (cytosine-N4-specific)